MWREYPKFQPDELLEYLRKSQSDDASLTVEEVLSRHESDLQRWQDANLSAPIPQSNIYKEVVSGESISSREEFKKLLKRIESPKIKGVLVIDCARLGRPDTEEIGRITKLFRYTNTMVITPQRIFDMSDEWDREQFEREMMRGRDYLDYTKKVLSRGKEISLRAGWYINAITPYGYEREWVDEGRRKRPTLAIVEKEAKIIRMIFDWYVNEEIGAIKISQRLNAMGIPSRKGIEWKKSTITNILKNEHYIGKVVIKKHIDVNVVEDSKITSYCVFNPDYEVVDGKHKPIIDEEIFHRANNKISKHVSVKPNKTLQNPFASILKCECGRVMIRRKNHNSFRYLCDEQMFCGNASVSENDLIEAIISKLKLSLENLSAEVKDNDDDKKQREKHTERISLLESRYVEIEKKELSLWDKYAEENMPKKVFDKLMENCMTEKQNIENQLEDARNNVPQHTNYNGAIATLHETIDALSNNSISASAKNNLLKSVVEKIVYKRPKAIRMSVEEAKAKGITLQGGWYCSPFELDVHLNL